MRIGQLARLAGTTPETIRFYERSGLLPPPDRTDGNFREFGPLHVERLEFIRRCRTLGIGLEEVHALLSFRDEPCGHCTGVNELLDLQIRQVSDQIARLQALREQLRSLRSSCPGGGPISECGILQGLAGGSS